ncbi:MAG: type II toxin-antitoxin system VapC family toxin [Candidatus Dormibacteraeota bacterium]|nr:type II toxin-antitoxin system VapC family toxin [Candidatus Dormibacteraeota bacterium]
MRTATAIEGAALSVIDASVFVEALVVTGPSGDVARAELRTSAVLEVPAIFGAEAASALRRMVMRGELNAVRASTGLDQIRRVRAVRHPFEPFARRTWELHDNLTVYDAWYVALAESLGTDLVTTDARIVSAPGTRCRIRRPGDAV